MKPLLLEHTNPANGSFTIREHIGTTFQYPYHFHNSYEITYIAEGKGVRLIGNSLMSFEQGDLVMMGPNLPHCWRNHPVKDAIPAKIRAIVIRFKSDFAGKAFFQLPENHQILQLLSACENGLEFDKKTSKMVGHSMKEIIAPDGTNRLICLLQILNTLSSAQNRKEVSLLSSTITGTRDIEKIEKVMNFITTHYLEKITLDQVAAIAGMNRSSFCRYFKRTYQKTFVSMVKELRVSHACRLIREGKYSITDVCYSSGFNNYSNFERSFKQFMGIAPKEYRRKMHRIVKAKRQ